MPSLKYSEGQLYQRIINKQTKLKGLVKAEFDQQGKFIGFRTTFDDYLHEDISQAYRHIMSSGISDYRVFGEAPFGSEFGLSQIAEEARFIQKELGTISPIQQEILRRLGLEDVADKRVSISYRKYAYEDEVGLTTILNARSTQEAGLKNLTSKNVTVINYKLGQKALTTDEALALKYVLGIGTLTDNFITKVLGNNISFDPNFVGNPNPSGANLGGLAKVQKRIQGMVSDRQLSLVGEAVEEAFDNVYEFDDVGATFRAMLGGKTTKEERYLLTSGLGIGSRDMQDVVKGTERGKRILRKALEDEFLQISKLDEINPQSKKVIKQMRKVFVEQAKGDFGKFKEIISSKSATGLSEETMLLIEASFDGVERMRDGEFVGNVKMVDKFIEELEQAKRAIIENNQVLSEDLVDEIKDIDNQLDSLKYMKKVGEEDLDSVVARLQLQKKQGKGEMLLKSFVDRHMPQSLKDKMLIMPKSAFKSEVQGVPSALFDVSKSHKDVIYSDPLMILYHQDYFAQPEIRSGMEKNVEKQMSKIKEFLETGQLDEDVRKQIFGVIESQLEEPEYFSKMDSAARSSYVRNRMQALKIKQMMEAGVDPRKIPELVRKVTDHYTANAYRLKDGQRIDVAMPDSGRFALRTYKSSMDPAKGATLYSKAKISVGDLDVSNLGLDKDFLVEKLGTEAEINFVQFRARGHRLLMPGAAAHLYHHALGTFDLDDKGVPLLTTFIDSDGRDRFAFMTMRQPTGFQEKIFFQADLTDYDTLKAFLEHMGSQDAKYGSLINDVEATSLAQTPKEQRVLQIMKDVLNGNKIPLHRQGISSSDIEELIIKLRSSIGEKHGFGQMVKMTDQDLLSMAATKSASPLGIDKIMGRISSGTTGAKSFFEVLLAKGLKPDAMPDYTTGNFVKLIGIEQAKADEKQIVEIFNQKNNSSFQSLEEISQYQKTITDPVERGIFDVNLKRATDLFQTKLQTEVASSVEDSLGNYINRSVTSISVTQQIDDVLRSFESETVDGESLADFYRRNFSVAMIDPSSAVDVEKSLIGEMVLQEEQMRNVAAALDDMARSGRGINVATLEKVLKDLFGESMKEDEVKRITLGAVGQKGLSQSGKGVGFLRAKQMFAGQTENLIGFDASLFGKNPYSRIKSGKDRALIIESFVQGANQFLETLTEEEKASEQAIYVRDYINSIQSSRGAEQLSKITLEAGSRYAVQENYVRYAKSVRQQLEELADAAQVQAQGGTDILEATARSQYAAAIEQTVESQRQNIQEIIDLNKKIARLTAGSESVVEETFMRDFLKAKTNTFFYDAVSAIQERHQGSNILDIVDTLEARISASFNSRIAEQVLASDVGIVGGESRLVELLEQARVRRAQKAIRQNVNDANIDTIEAITQRSLGKNVTEITAEEAKEALEKVDLKEIQRFANMSGLSFNEYLAQIGQPGTREYYDFLQLLSGQKKLSEEVSEAAADAFKFSNAEKILSTLESPELVEARNQMMISGRDISDEARAIVDVADEEDEVTNIFSGTYKRFKDSFKNGAMKDVFEDKLIRRSTFAIAGLAAFGFIYSAAKDRSQEDISGPPLLPGGSAYESDYPRQLPSISDLKYLNPTTLGMQYKINMSGSEDQIEKMQYLANSVVGGQVDSTIYDGLPRLGRDPYQNIANSF